MYDEQLEKLIEIGIKDGVLTQTERKVIVNKAIKLGIDEDEIIMVLEDRLEERRKAMGMNDQQSAQSSSKPLWRKCPECGAGHTPGVRLCPDCGHKFPSPSEELARELQQAAESVRTSRSKAAPIQNVSLNDALGYIKRKGLIGVLSTLIEGESGSEDSKIHEAQVRVLTSFPTPEDRDGLLDLIEFIHTKNQIYEFGEDGLTKERGLITIALNKFSDSRDVTKRLKNYQKLIKEELDF